MAIEIATVERVRDAMAMLRRRGSKPTADKVILLIGGGSKSTVLSHMKALREMPADDDDLPPHVLDIARPLLVEVFAQGRHAEAGRTKAATERLAQLLEEQDEQIAEFAANNEILAAEASQLREETASRSKEIAELEERLLMTEATVVHLRDSLAEERRTSSASLKDALSRMEALVRGERGALRDRRKVAGPVPKSSQPAGGGADS